LADVFIISAVFIVLLATIVGLARRTGASDTREKGLRDTVEQMARIEKAGKQPRPTKSGLIDRLRDGKF